MSKTVFCPGYIGKCPSQEVIDLLYKIPSTRSNIKVAVDQDLAIFERYLEQPDVNGLVEVWIRMLIDSFPNRIAKVTKLSTPENLSNQELCINIAKEVQSYRKIVIDDEDDYFHLKEEVALSGIRLIERHEAHRIFKKDVAFEVQKFSQELVEIAHRLTERKINAKIENFRNDIVTDLLRNRGYSATDQTRSGKSSTGIDAGELDIAIRRNNGIIESIIEAFRLSSCGMRNTTVAEHLDKLIHDYDCTGVRRSFVLVYAEAQSFGKLWHNYINYLNKLNKQTSFKGANKLISFSDVSNDYACSANIRAGLAVHSRDIANLEVFHIFIKMM